MNGDGIQDLVVGTWDAARIHVWHGRWATRPSTPPIRSADHRRAAARFAPAIRQQRRRGVSRVRSSAAGEACPFEVA